MLRDVLKQLRKSKGITQEELAAAVGVERSSIGKYEGKQKEVLPSYDVLLRIAEYFGVTINYLLDVPEPAVTYNPDQVVDMVAKMDESTLLNLYRQLNDKGRADLMRYARYLLSDPDYQLRPSTEEPLTGAS